MKSKNIQRIMDFNHQKNIITFKGNNIKSAAPKNGQASLDKSVCIKSTTTRRVSVDGNKFVVFDETLPGVFHGHVREWNQLTQNMKNALIDAGLANRRGKIL